MSQKRKVYILGAGPTGLAAACRLAEKGIPTEIIERLPWVGGLSATYQRGPYKLDLGPHRFTPTSDEVFNFVNDLMKGEMITVKYKAQILIDGKLIAYPFKLTDLIRHMPFSVTLSLIKTFLLSMVKPKSKGNEVTYEEWIVAHFGRGLTEIMFRPLIEKVWGLPLTQLSAKFARQRIAITSLWEILWEVIIGKRKAEFRSPYYPDNCFLYPINGTGVIMDRMGEKFVKDGGTITTGATVTEIHQNGDRISKIVYEKDGKKVEVDPEFVISTLPVQYFFEIMKPSPPAKAMEAARSLRTRRLILLFLVLKKDRFSENTSLYYPSLEFPFGRVWEQKNHSVKTVDVPGKTVLGIEIPCWQDDSTWKSTDQQLADMAVKPLQAHGWLDPKDIEEVFSVKLGFVYPVWDVHFEKNLETLLEVERGIENLILNGRPGLFFYNNVHHSIEMGFVSAEHVISGKPKKEKWDVEMKGFEKFKLVE